MKTDSHFKDLQTEQNSDIDFNCSLGTKRHRMWWKLPLYIALLTLVGFRKKLLKENLYDSYQLVNKTNEIAFECLDPNIGLFASIVCSEENITYRTIDGTCNDLKNPAMGSLYYRLGRNVPLANATPDSNLLEPNPLRISSYLLRRRRFIPAETLNLLAAAWTQFMVHDWFDHGENMINDYIKVPIPMRNCGGRDGDDDDDDAEADDDPTAHNEKASGYDDFINDLHCYPHDQKYWEVRKTTEDPCRIFTNEGRFQAYQNYVTHWWDASQIYGSDPATNKKLRSFEGGKLKLGRDGLLPVDKKTGIEITGFTRNWWMGLSLLHNVFTKEHNAICDMLKEKYKDWTDQGLYNTARLINSALMAKIHTIEWTPAMMNNKVGRKAMYGQWSGILQDDYKNLFGHTGDIFKSGFPGAKKDHHGVPFSMTEEFVAVYRMHSLLPSRIPFYHIGSKEGTYYNLRTLFFRSAKFREYTFSDILYTFGKVRAGALTLKNYPNTLRNLELPSGEYMDLAAIDIIRDRERGLPRYNQYRQLLGMEPIKSFADLTPDRYLQRQLARLYSHDVNKIDLLIGCLAEDPRPSNWGFTDTTFRVFIVMASRRLLSDRFYTDYYNSTYYTQEGMEWIQTYNFKDVLLRAFPSLKNVLSRVENPFFPWNNQRNWKQ